MLRLVIEMVESNLAEGTERETMLERMRALRETYGLVAAANWGEVALADLAAKEFGNYGIGRDGRLAVEGPDVLLRAKAAVSLGMALHEVAANAARHGALSVPQGRVRLGWRIEDPGTPEARLVIDWRESGGPPLDGPQARGYGRELIETGLREQIGAAGSLTFADGGVTAEIALPLSSGLVLAAGGDQEREAAGSRKAGATEEPD
jgi:two-component sensor histidine kinase